MSTEQPFPKPPPVDNSKFDAIREAAGTVKSEVATTRSLLRSGNLASAQEHAQQVLDPLGLHKGAETGSAAQSPDFEFPDAERLKELGEQEEQQRQRPAKPGILERLKNLLRGILYGRAGAPAQQQQQAEPAQQQQVHHAPAESETQDNTPAQQQDNSIAEQQDNSIAEQQHDPQQSQATDPHSVALAEAVERLQASIATLQRAGEDLAAMLDKGLSSPADIQEFEERLDAIEVAADQVAEQTEITQGSLTHHLGEDEGIDLDPSETIGIDPDGFNLDQDWLANSPARTEQTDQAVADETIASTEEVEAVEVEASVGDETIASAEEVEAVEVEASTEEVDAEEVEADPQIAEFTLPSEFERTLCSQWVLQVSDERYDEVCSHFGMSHSDLSDMIHDTENFFKAAEFSGELKTSTGYTHPEVAAAIVDIAREEIGISPEQEEAILEAEQEEESQGVTI
jgi:hypothetical protein